MLTAAKQTLQQATTQVQEILNDPLHAFKFLQRTIALVCIAIPFLFWAADHDACFPTAIAMQTLESHPSGAYRVDTLHKTSRFGEGMEFITVQNTSSHKPLLSLLQIEKDRLGFRKSISHYAYSSTSYLFGLLYGMAAMLFIFNGALYLRNHTGRQDGLQLEKGGPWYNILIGLFLIGVVLNPLYGRAFLHVIFSVLFFAGNIVVIAFFPNPGERSLSKRLRYTMAGLALLFVLLPFVGSASIPVLWGEWLSLTVIALHLFLVALYVKKSADTLPAANLPVNPTSK